MASPGLRSVIRRLVSAQTGANSPDQHLLERFRAHKDEAAFAALVERHGAMVLGVAWNVLNHLQDAEDVVQAAFLVLARKADSVRNLGSVGSWLHGVAYRLALKSRTAAAVRLRYESQVPGQAPGATPDDLTWRELNAILHQELERLPDKYRAPLVLCYIGGMTQDQASEHLSLAKGTLKGRLERARLLLRSRLLRLGLAPAVVLLADAYRPVSAALPAPVVATVAQAAKAFAAGLPAGVSVQVARMTEGALQTMFMTKLRSAALLLAVTLVVVGIGVLASRGAFEGPPAKEGLSARGQDTPGNPGTAKGQMQPWGEAVDGWRMRLTLPSGAEYRRNKHLPLLLEVQNVSKDPQRLESLGWWNPDAEVTEDGKRLVVRQLIDVSPWEGKRNELAAGASLSWTIDFGRLRFFQQALKAGTELRIRFRQAMPNKAGPGAPEASQPPPLFSNEVALKLADDHPSVMASEADLSPKWTDSTALMYKENVPFWGYQALRIDGAGRVWLASSLKRGMEKGGKPLTRTEAVLSRERLDRLAQFLRDQKVWELAGLSKDKIANPDEPEIRFSYGMGFGSLVEHYPDSLVRGQAKLQALKAEMEDVIATAIKEAAAKEPPVDTPPRKPEELFQKLTEAIRKHSSEAKIETTATSFVAKAGTMTFTIHNRGKAGEFYPPTYQEEGPNFKGFVLHVEIREGKYEGAAVIPQTLGGPYFPTFIDATTVDRENKHYFVSFSYGSRLDPDLKKVIQELIPINRLTPD